jgi:hypothetical protein
MRLLLQGPEEVLTQNERNCQDLTTNSAKQELAHVANIIDVPMTQLEDTDNVVRPCSDTSDGTQADNAWDKAQGVEDSWDRKNTQPDLRFHHESDRSKPPNLLTIS